MAMPLLMWSTNIHVMDIFRIESIWKNILSALHYKKITTSVRSQYKEMKLSEWKKF